MIEWVRSSKCGGGECVEVAFVGKIQPTVLVRNSRAPEHVLIFDTEEWQAFTAGVAVGEFRLDDAANVS